MSSTNIADTKKDVSSRMEGALEVLQKEFGALRTGRASTSLLEPIMIEAYGTQLPLNQVGTVGIPEPRTLTVQVWDKTMVKSVEKAIMESGLGLNPISDGQLVRVPLPALTEERRLELSKIAAKYAEDARVAVRNVRRHAMDELKRSEKDGSITEDEHHDYSQEVQDLTDRYVKKIDEILSHKEKDILQV